MKAKVKLKNYILKDFLSLKIEQIKRTYDANDEYGKGIRYGLDLIEEFMKHE